MGANSHDLVVISKEGSEHDATERRRRPRLSLSSEQFRIEAGGGSGKTFNVSDISEDGLAIRIIDPEDFASFMIASRVKGTLNLQREKFPLELIVRRISKGQVGCQFVDLKGGTRVALARFLDPSVLGAELRPIPADGNQIWYHGPSGTDLLFARGTDGRMRRMTLYVLGSYVLWDEDDGLQTGRAIPANEIAETRGIVRFESLMLESDAQPDPAKLRIAKTLFMSSNIPQDLKGWCTRHL